MTARGNLASAQSWSFQTKQAGPFSSSGPFPPRKPVGATAVARTWAYTISRVTAISVPSTRFPPRGHPGSMGQADPLGRYR